MKIETRFYPWIILGIFLLCLLAGLALGFRPEHRGSGRYGQSLLNILAFITGFEVVS